MTDTITLTGLVATNPRHIVTSEGLTITSFRLASNQRRFDRGQKAWIDGDTNWYTVTAFRQLGTHVASSLEKGQRVLVTGRVRIRDWETEDKSGTSIEIDAEAIGHDLTWGRASFTRSVVAKSADRDGASEPATASAETPGEDGGTPVDRSTGAGKAEAREDDALAATPF
jgi:single-strand DNA-binding protein